ncbi:LppP/LprE family lipoprotein [Nocardia sp. NBC_00508]|uniref:LppP/LprE family lipoprotein n=1 Tax=Nocardia sp. NBC_00508 TaxID=2975992 RepID=UPI002E806A43|nr:LppP/LprE family lipoprotein [Nocardia sp. NBC_00508]WUD65682.1 LppP/LprE family lipoprotein [Nocardia sp. NBC_00508]
MNHAVRMGALVVAAAALVAGCNSIDDTATPAPTSQGATRPTESQVPGASRAPDVPGTVTQAPTVTQPPAQPDPPAPVTTVTAPSSAEGIGSAGRCIDPTSAGVQSALAGLGDGWVAEHASADRPGSCGQLLWVSAAGGMSAGAPIHVLFFHDGKYLGTATSEPYAFTYVAGSNGNSVTVEYKWLVADEPFAAPQGGPVAITYTWTGSRVTMSEPLPTEVTQPHR